MQDPFIQAMSRGFLWFGLILLASSLATLFCQRVFRRTALKPSEDRETYYEDLAPCLYFREWGWGGEKLKAVGWLARGHPYTQQEVPEEIFRKLLQLLVDPWEPCCFCGRQECRLCTYPGSYRLTRYGSTIDFGASNLFVPAAGFIYVAPSMIVHYIDAHGYAPPTPFYEAVLKCPEMGSDAYRQALIVNGPRNEDWVRTVWWERNPNSAR